MCNTWSFAHEPDLGFAQVQTRREGGVLQAEGMICAQARKAGFGGVRPGTEVQAVCGAQAALTKHPRNLSCPPVPVLRCGSDAGRGHGSAWRMLCTGGFGWSEICKVAGPSRRWLKKASWNMYNTWFHRPRGDTNGFEQGCDRIKAVLPENCPGSKWRMAQSRALRLEWKAGSVSVCDSASLTSSPPQRLTQGAWGRGWGGVGDSENGGGTPERQARGKWHGMNCEDFLCSEPQDRKRTSRRKKWQ